MMVSPGIDFREGPLDYSRDSERWRWTAGAIDAAKSDGIPWTVVGMHVPCFSVGRYDCQAGEDLTNMLVEKKVDLVLSGHDHSGVGLYDINSKDSEMGYFAAASGKNRNPAFGTLDVTATPGELTARFVPAEGSSLTDSFRIERQ